MPLKGLLAPLMLGALPKGLHNPTSRTRFIFVPVSIAKTRHAREEVQEGGQKVSPNFHAKVWGVTFLLKHRPTTIFSLFTPERDVGDFMN